MIFLANLVISCGNLQYKNCVVIIFSHRYFHMKIDLYYRHTLHLGYSRIRFYWPNDALIREQVTIGEINGTNKGRGSEKYNFETYGNPKYYKTYFSLDQYNRVFTFNKLFLQFVSCIIINNKNNKRNIFILGWINYFLQSIFIFLR